jgi:hypothetical protein
VLSFLQPEAQAQQCIKQERSQKELQGMEVSDKGTMTGPHFQFGRSKNAPWLSALSRTNIAGMMKAYG